MMDTHLAATYTLMVPVLLKPKMTVMGGPNMYYPHKAHPHLLASVETWVGQQPPVTFHGVDLPYTLDILVNGLVDKYEETKQFKTWCRTKTVF